MCNEIETEKKQEIPFYTYQRVCKRGGEYTFEGIIVSIFAKRTGGLRYVVEDDRGLLMIMNPSQLIAAK